MFYKRFFFILSLDFDRRKSRTIVRIASGRMQLKLYKTEVYIK